MPDSGNASLWQQVNGLRDDLHLLSERIARMEEQQRVRAEAALATQRKVDELHTLAIEARGAGRAAAMFGKWGYGVVAAAGALLATYWPIVKKWLP